jgi:RNA-directed DNA polymerase
MADTSRSQTVSTKSQRIAELAKRHPTMRLTTLAHHMDMDWLRAAYDRTRKDGASGIDGQTAEEFAADLDGNLLVLLNQAKSGTYRAPPVRRVYIPKGNGEQRPLGIPTFADKVLQRAAAMVLEAVYEQDFSDCSYGFRPGRSPHQALDVLWRQTMNMKECWIVELDIRKFFDNLDHAKLREILGQRIGDGVLLRLIGKWLNAGVMEDGAWRAAEAGTPQGGVISPLLANVYLHEVLDTWFQREVVPRMHGASFLVRFADDAVLGFACEQDARRVLEVLPKRFGRFGLQLHPAKTRLVAFNAKAKTAHPKDNDNDPPGTFTFLGFTHYWALSRKGRPVVKRKTATSRLSRALKAIRDWCARHRHKPVAEQHQALTRKVQGHYAYYGITGNNRSLGLFFEQVKRAWRTWLSRRSQKAYVNWDKFNALLGRYRLPTPKIVHSIYRAERTDAPKSRMR